MLKKSRECYLSDRLPSLLQSIDYCAIPWAVCAHVTFMECQAEPVLLSPGGQCAASCNCVDLWKVSLGCREGDRNFLFFSGLCQGKEALVNWHLSSAEIGLLYQTRGQSMGLFTIAINDFVRPGPQVSVPGGCFLFFWSFEFEFLIKIILFGYWFHRHHESLLLNLSQRMRKTCWNPAFERCDLLL